MSEVILTAWKNKSGKEYPILEFKNGSKFPTRVGIKKTKCILDNLEAVKMILAQSGLWAYFKLFSTTCPFSKSLSSDSLFFQWQMSI